MIRRILIITLVLTPLCFGVASAGETTGSNDSTLNPAEGCYGDPGWIYAQADDPPPPGPGWQDPPPFDTQFRGPDGFPGPGPQHLERLRLRKLLELLELDDNQRERFIELFQGMRTSMMENRHKTKELVDRLAEGLRGGDMPDSEIDQLLAEIDNLEVRQLEQMQNLRMEFKTLLTPVQLGKFYIFRERFEPRLLERLHQWRQGRGPKGPFGPDEFPDDSMDPMKR